MLAIVGKGRRSKNNGIKTNRSVGDDMIRDQKNIAEKLKTITGAKQIKLALKVDPQLIGGFTIEIGSKMIDTSIRGQLKQISSLLGA